jgi:hypothetical protein
MAEKQIRKAMRKIYDEGAVNAAQVYKGTDYDGTNVRTGWFFRLFGRTPTHLGKSVEEALGTIEDIRASREEANR